MKQLGNQPWVNKHLLALIKERNKFYRYSKKYNNDIYVNNRLSDLSKLVKKTNNKLKRDWYFENLNSSISNPRKFWKYLKFVIFSKMHDNNKIVIEKNKILYENNEIIANEFNKHFINTAKSIVANIPSQSLLSKVYLDKLSYKCSSNFELKEIGVYDVIETVNGLNMNAACGIYDISTKIVVKYISKLAPVITILINDCIKKNDFPDILKTSKIIPIFKNGNATNVDNYRGISILIVFAKIFEKIIFKELRNHFDLNNIIS